MYVANDERAKTRVFMMILLPLVVFSLIFLLLMNPFFLTFLLTPNYFVRIFWRLIWEVMGNLTVNIFLRYTSKLSLLSLRILKHMNLWFRVFLLVFHTANSTQPVVALHVANAINQDFMFTRITLYAIKTNLSGFYFT